MFVTYRDFPHVYSQLLVLQGAEEAEGVDFFVAQILSLLPSNLHARNVLEEHTKLECEWALCQITDVAWGWAIRQQQCALTMERTPT